MDLEARKTFKALNMVCGSNTRCQLYKNNVFFQVATDEQYRILTVPRARKVHQSLLTVPITTFRSLLSCIYHVTAASMLHPKTRPYFADVLILNGPGTCLPLCCAVYINRV